MSNTPKLVKSPAPFLPFLPISPFLRETSLTITTENDNLRGEYSELFKDVEQDISWARIALDQISGPDAINLWIGNSRSVTALHRDNYENIYVQVIGEKHFALVSPVETACIMEKPFPSATYAVSTPFRDMLFGDDG